MLQTLLLLLQCYYVTTVTMLLLLSVTVLLLTPFTIINDRETGRSRGFGFVTFNNEQSMKDAISQMNGSELDGRNITVNEAQSRGSGGGGGGGRREGGGGYGGGGGRREGGYGEEEVGVWRGRRRWVW
ncbi:hypothetical protein Leryth_009583, partial [Lithospermum erythrorhizon]